MTSRASRKFLKEGSVPEHLKPPSVRGKSEASRVSARRPSVNAPVPDVQPELRPTSESDSDGDLTIYDVTLVKQRGTRWGFTVKMTEGSSGGVRIQQVRKDSPAGEWNNMIPMRYCKIRTGDVLLAVNGKLVDCQNYQEELAKDWPPDGETKFVELLFMRPVGLENP